MIIIGEGGIFYFRWEKEGSFSFLRGKGRVTKVRGYSVLSSLIGTLVGFRHEVKFSVNI